MGESFILTIVVVKQNVKRSLTSQRQSNPENESSKHIFDVQVSGADADCSEFEMNAFYWSPYVTRSFMIVNRESIPLEVMVKSRMNVDEQSELIFSLSKNYAKLFRLLKIAPFGRVRVYIHFTAIPEHELITDSTYYQSRGSVKVPSNLTFAESEERSHERKFEIYLNCRLVLFSIN